MPLAILTVPRHSLIAAFLVGLTCAPAVALAPSAQPAKSAAAKQAELAQNYGKLPISFEANRGQTDPSVQFLSRGSGYSLYLTDSSAVLSLSKAASSGKDCHPEQTGAPADSLSPLGTESEGSGSHPPRQTQSARPCDPASDSIRMELSGANPQAKVAGTDQLPGIANYFLGKDPARWHTNIPTYAKVRYTGVYPGIDLVYYGNQRQLEYDFIVAPNANPSTIQLHFAGAQNISLTPTGDLTIQSKNGQIAFRKPEIYQEVSGKRLAVAGSFVLTARSDVSFHIGQYDKTRPLTIDPVVAYSTYFGLPDATSDGSSTDVVDAVAMDASGSAYIAGYVESGEYSTGAAFVSKLNASGSAVLYSTYLSNVTPVAIAVDNAGRAYITGAVPNTSEFENFPVTQGVFQTVATSKYPVAFVAAIDATGSNLIYASFLGGTGSATRGGDQGTGIAVDGAGNAYVTGITASSNFPVTSGAFQKVNNTANSLNVGNAFPNAFVTKVNPAGTALVYSTYLGGNRNDGAIANPKA